MTKSIRNMIDNVRDEIWVGAPCLHSPTDESPSWDMRHAMLEVLNPTVVGEEIAWPGVLGLVREEMRAESYDF